MKLFISYEYHDIDLVRTQIVDILHAVGEEILFNYNLTSGHNLQHQVKEKIATCNIFIYAMTAKSMTSGWCRWEVNQAIQLGKPILPVLLEKTRIPDDLHVENYIDLTAKFGSIGAVQMTKRLNDMARDQSDREAIVRTPPKLVSSVKILPPSVSTPLIPTIREETRIFFRELLGKKFGFTYQEQKAALFLIAVALLVAMILTIAIILTSNNPTNTILPSPTQPQIPSSFNVSATPSLTRTPRMGGGVLLSDTFWYTEPNLDAAKLSPNLPRDVFVIISGHRTDGTNHLWYRVTAGGLAGWVRALRDDGTPIINANEYITANEFSYTQGIPTVSVTATPTPIRTLRPTPISTLMRSQTPPAGCQATHIVEANETLFSIILLYPPVPFNRSAASREIAEANGLSNPNALYIGQSLCIPFFTDFTD